MVSGKQIKDFLIGDYDWVFLCKPRLPFGEKSAPPPFFQKDEPLSLFLCLAMGMQHALAMVGGIITVPLLVSGSFNGNFTPTERRYVISASLIISGIASFIQASQFKIPFTRYVIGSGLLSVMGISFTFLPIANSSIANMKKCYCAGELCLKGSTCNGCPVPLTGSCNTGQEAYGRLMGSVLVCSLLEVAMSFLPPKVIQKMFPPVVSGTTVMLIGFALSASGFKAWGGGDYCASQVLTSKVLCDTNGEVKLPFGSRQYIGLGFVVFSTFIIVEIFGSPFLRNIQVVIGLFVGMVVASAASYKNCSTICTPNCEQKCFQVLPLGVSFNNVTNEILVNANSAIAYFSNSTVGNSTVCQSFCQAPTCISSCETQKYVTSKEIDDAKWFNFLWTTTFPLGFYAPAVLPLLFGYMVSTIECVGDITATTESSGFPPVGPEFETSIQGGILADGLNCFFGALAFMLPTVTYAGNNGIIALTKCAARRAGKTCAIILFCLGLFSKTAGIILSIPDCVLGGMTSFLFINVAVSGMRILTMEGKIDRRNRFICAMALTIGLGVTLVPAWVNIAEQSGYPNEGNLWPIKSGWSENYKGFRDALVIVLSNGFSIGGFSAIILNLIIPYDKSDEEEFDDPKKSIEDGEVEAPPEQKMAF